MRGRTRKEHDYKRAFILDAEGLKSIANVVQRAAADENGESEGESDAQQGTEYPMLSFNATLSDDSKLVDYTLEEILAFPNNKKRQLTELELEPTGLEDVSLRVKFMKAGTLESPISYTLSGEDDQVVIWSNRLDERIKAMTPWYWFLARYSLLVWVWALILLGLLGIGIVEALDDLFYPNLLREVQPNNGSIVLGLARALLISLPFIALELVRRYLFPKADFALGAGKQRSGVRATVRKAVVGLFCITLPIAVLTTLLR